MPGKTSGPPIVVALPDEIDLSNHDAMAASLLSAVDNPGLVIADMTATTFCDSAGLRTLLIARDHAVASGATLRIAIKPKSAVARSMAVLGFDRILPVYPSMRDAAAARPVAARVAP